MHQTTVLAQTLPELFGAERADAVKFEAEDETVFAAGADVERVVLHGDRAAVVGVAERVERADKRRSAGWAAVFEVEKERRAAVKTLVAVADKDGRTPLRTAQGSGFLAVRVGVTGERRDQANGAGVIKSLKNFQQFRIVADGCGNRPKPVILHAEIQSCISENRFARTVGRVDIERRKSSGNSAERVERKRGDRRDLVSLSGYQCAAEGFIEEIFSADGQGKNLVGLNRQRIFLRLCGVFLQTLLRFARHGFGVFARVEAVCDAEFDLVRVGFAVGVIEADDLVEIVDALDQTIGGERFDDVAEAKGVIFTVKISR